MGYDGNGVKIIRKMEDLDYLTDQECMVENLVPFTHELAVTVVRNPSGEIKTYPVVEMEFHPEANQVEYVLCPARIDESIKEKATQIALQVSKALNHVGLLAVELFLTEEGIFLSTRLRLERITAVITPLKLRSQINLSNTFALF